MRYIDQTALFSRVFATDAGRNVKSRLGRAHKKSARMAPINRKTHSDHNGPNKWKPVKDLMTILLGHKCWYTEVELTGAPLVVDHYRPVILYWWLAYDAENYRIACPWANSLQFNPMLGRTGGKGEKFPLLPPEIRAKGKNSLRIERPVILDPCNAKDCELLAFHTDGRPILNPAFANDKAARRRVEESKILLNLDHPDFNSKREQLRVNTEEDVNTYVALPVGSPERTTIRNRIKLRLAPMAAFSTAARFYLQLHRHLDWVQDILDEQ